MNLKEVMELVEMENKKKDKIQNLELLLLNINAKISGHKLAIITHEQDIKHLNNDANLITSEIISTLKGMIK